MMIRPASHTDITGLQEVVTSTELFPSELLPDMMSGFLAGNDSSDIWLTCEAGDGRPIGFCYARSEELAQGAWNMLAIAVLATEQGRGCGRAIVRQLEQELKARGQRILIADTSSTQEFTRTREFYRKNGYVEEARIRDFWAAADDKIIFWKSLT